jgi:histidinol-phosphate aminotransferase
MTNKLIKQWIRPEIQALSAYHVPDPGNMIKLDAMENPYTWPQVMITEWQSLLQDTALNRYPDPASRSLQLQIRTAFAIPDDMGVLLGNGSDEIIQIMAMAVATPERVILAPEPGFVMYNMIARFVGMQYVGVPLHADDFSLDMPAMMSAIVEHKPAIIFLAYPNNPTGNLFARDQVEEIIQLAPGLVVLDEAYAAFADDSFMANLGQYSNLLVMRTVSKMGLAGLRLGYLAGPLDCLQEFDKIRLPYNINVLTQVSAEFALRHKDVLDHQTTLLRQERARLYQQMTAIAGLTVYPSEANFILFRVAEGRANALFEALKSAGVLIKNLANAGGLLQDCLRVTVGKPEENDRFIEVVSGF